MRPQNPISFLKEITMIWQIVEFDRMFSLGGVHSSSEIPRYRGATIHIRIVVNTRVCIENL